tara:strand:- start:3766 stop:8463 length:4698 start_codon:yes stop_codon:yes gene_type:complete
MADLIEIGVSFVDRGDGMKKAVSTVDRLEAKMTKLIKGLNSGTVSNDRFQKSMVVASRELKKNSDLVGNQAYNAMQKYVAAKKRSIQAEQDSARSIALETVALKSNKAALDAQRTATKANTASLNSFRLQNDAVYRSEQKLLSLKKLLRAEVVNGNMTMREAAAVQMQYKRSLDTMGGGLVQAARKTNQLGVVTQQVGYQVGDFAVQVQGGQSVFVAFSQQATQLVGVLPLLSDKLNISAGRLIAISAGLGIAIPLLSALGGALYALYKDSDLASKGLDKLKEAQEALNTATGDYSSKLDQLTFGVDTSAEAVVLKELMALRKRDADLSAEYIATNSLSRRQAIAEEALDNKKTISGLKIEAELLAAKREEYETFKNLREGEAAAQESFNALLKERQDLAWKSMQAAKEDIKTQEQANALKLAENTYTKESVQYLALIQQYETEVLEARIKSERLTPIIADALRDALKTSQTFAQVDMGLSIRNATLDTNSLIGRLNAAVRLAQIAANPILGRSDERGSQVAQTVSAGTFKADQSLDAANERRAEALRESAKSATDSAKASDKLADALEKEAEALKKQADEMNLSANAVDKYNDGLAKLLVLKEKYSLSDDAFANEVAKLNEELGNSLPLVNDVADAFGDFMSRGFSDFKSFASSIGNSFKQLLIEMATNALRSKILIPLATGMSAGFAGSAASAAGSSAASAAGGAAGGGMLGSIGAGAGLFASSVGTGMSVVGSGFAAGGLGGAATAGMGAVSGGIGAGGLAGFGTALGAVALPLLAVGVALAFFKKKTKELDSGINVTVKNMDTLVESFSKVQTSRFFGLSKKESTSNVAASKDVSDPITLAVNEIQNQVVKAADALGIASTAFNGFTHEFRLSLKGLTEEQAMAKINEELVKMGDSFASMTGLFSTVNELLTVTQQRITLETQLLTMQGKVVKLRKQELDAVHVLNKGLAARIQLLQAEADMSSALAAFASGISEQQGLIKSAVDALIEPLLEAINRVKTQAEASYKIFSEAADKTRGEAQTIVDLLRGALNARTIKSEGLELMRYKQAQQQLSAFAGGASFDKESLSKATQGVSIDSEKFFGSFADYARDFYKTQITLDQLEKKASEQLTDVEKQIEIADKAYQTAMGTYQESVDTNIALDKLLNDLAAYAEVAARNEPFIEQIKAEGDRQVELLDQILKEVTLQVNGLLGIENSIADLVGSNISVGEALSVLGLSGKELYGAVIALDAPIGKIGSHITDLETALGNTLTVSGNQIYNTILAMDGSVGKIGDHIVSLDETFGSTLSGLGLIADNLKLGFVGVDGTILSLGVSATDLGTNIVSMGTNIANLGMSTTTLGIDINNLGGTVGAALDGLGSTVSTLSGGFTGLIASNTALEAALTAAASSIAASKAATVTASEDKKDPLQKTITIVEEIHPKGKASGVRLSNGQVFTNSSGKGNAQEVEYATIQARRAVQKAGNIAAFATGGMHSGGLRLVGENGPEIEATGPSRIYSNQQTKGLMSNSDSSETVSELRMLRQEISEMKAEQRSIGVENVKYNKKSYDLNRQWDIVGLPATRTS